MQYSSDAKLLKDILGIAREPVAVKMVRDQDELDSLNLSGYDADTKYRYCQAVMRAGEGEKVLLSTQNFACAAAAAAFGISLLHPKLASGEAHYNVGTFGAREAAHRIMREMPRLNQGEYALVIVSPLLTCEFQPDVILVEAVPENLMWLALASIYTTGERLQFSTSVVQATCVDSTIVPFTSGQPNATLGCTGCREATDLQPTENMIGIPFQVWPEIIENLANMEAMIVKNRHKGSFERLKNKQ